MNDRDINQVLKRIRTVIYHVGTFEGSYPRILKDAPVYTRSHLIVFYEILPDLIRLLEFSSETIPVVSKILGLATEGKSDLEKATEYLGTINKSSEMAVTEIFGALDQVGATLQKAQKTESADEEQKKTLKEANMQLMGIMNALQFQDITSQKIEATTALLAHLGDGLVGLIRELGVKVENHTIKVRQGTYDPDAAFDRETAGEKQGEIDDLVNAEKTQSAEVPAPPVEKTPIDISSPKTKVPENDVAAHDVVADVDDIDALVASAQNGQVDGDKTPKRNDEQRDDVAAHDVVADVDDIDALVASAQNGQVDGETPSGQNDIDALVASTQNGASEPAEPANDVGNGQVNQDDIDALLDQ